MLQSGVGDVRNGIGKYSTRQFVINPEVLQFRKLAHVDQNGVRDRRDIEREAFQVPELGKKLDVGRK
jgi:hypothetical protein